MPSCKSFGSWLGSTVAGTVAGLSTTALFTVLFKKIAGTALGGTVGIAIASSNIGAVAGIVSQLVTAISRDQQKVWGAASILRLLATPTVAAAFAIGGALLADFIYCQSQEHPNIARCVDNIQPFTSNTPTPTYLGGSVATLLGMVGAFAVKKTADIWSKNQGNEYEPLLMNNDNLSQLDPQHANLL